MKPLTKSGLKIIANLHRAKRPLSIKRISERTNLSWKTCNDNIKKLEQRKILSCERTKRRTYCKITKEAKMELERL